MKTRLAIGCLLMLCLNVLVLGQTGFSQTSLRNEVSGGIVFSNGQNAVYYDLKTNQSIILVRGGQSSPIKHVAIEPLGRTIIYTFGTNKLAQMSIPDGNQFVLPKLEQPFHKSGDPKWDRLFVRDKPYLHQEEVRNLGISPTVPYYLAFEHLRKGTKWIACESDSEEYNQGVSEEIHRKDEENWDSRHRHYGETRDKYPIRYRIEFVDMITIDIFYLERRPGGILLPREYGPLGKDQSDPCIDRYVYRSPAENNEETTLRTSIYSRNGKYFTEYAPLLGMNRRIIKKGYEKELSEEEVRKGREKIARGIWNARYTTWSPVSRVLPREGIRDEYPELAFIYHTSNDNKWGPIAIRNMGMGIISKEIPVSLNNCRGLAWKPDGTITYESEGRIYSEDGRVLVDGIDATRFYWSSNDLLLYRDSQGILWLQNTTDKRKEKLGDSLPEEFSYTTFSFLTPASGKGKAQYKDGGLGEQIFIGLTIPCWTLTGWAEDSSSGTTVEFDGRVYSGEAKKSVFLATADPVGRFNRLAYAYPKETKIEDIKDPSRYHYQYGGTNVYKDKVVSLNEIILLKDGRRYAAIKPVEIHVGKRTPIRGDSRYTKLGPDTYFVYEWKYWPPR